MRLSYKTKIQNLLFLTLILLNTFVNLIGGSTGGNGFFYASAIIFLFYGTTINFNYKINFIGVIYFVIALFSFFSLLYAPGLEFVIEDLPRVASNFIMIIIASTFINSSNRLFKTLTYSVFSILLLALPNLMFAKSGLREMFWGGVNPVGGMMFFAIIYTSILGFLKKRKFLLLIPIFLSVMIITQSQKVIISLVIVYTLLLLYSLIFMKFRQSRKYFLAAITVFLLFFFIINKTSIGDSMFRTEATFEQLTTGEEVSGSAIGSGYRNFLIDKGTDFFIDSPIFGHGLNQSRYLFQQSINKPTYTHNNILELLISFGFFLTILYLLIYIIILKKLVSKLLNKKNVFGAFLVLTVGAILLIGHFQKMYYDINTHLYLIIIFYIVSNKSKLYE